MHSWALGPEAGGQGDWEIPLSESILGKFLFHGMVILPKIVMGAPAGLLTQNGAPPDFSADVIYLPW